jgi:hypothetical protein
LIYGVKFKIEIMNLSKKKAEIKRELAKIKKSLIDSGEKCFFSGEGGPLDLFHICPVGTCPQHELHPINLVLAKREYNDIWVDRGTAEQVITIPNVHKAFVRMYRVDPLYYNRKISKMKYNLPEKDFNKLLQDISDCAQNHYLGY